MRKETCESCLSITTVFLKKHGYFSGKWQSGTITSTWANGIKNSVGITGGVGSDSHFRFQYTTTHYDGTKDVMDYRVSLIAAPCHFGGRRWWFVCPLVRDGVPCKRRVGVLYMGWKYFGCRRCYGLAYESQQKAHGRGKRGGFSRMLNLIWPLKDPEDIRVKWWRGRPTKRYLRALGKQGRLTDYMIDNDRLLEDDEDDKQNTNEKISS